MNKLIPTAVLISLATGPAFAGDDSHRGTKAGFIFGNAVAGTIIAGPIGGAAGALAGIWTSNKVIDGYEKEAIELELAEVSTENADMRTQLAMMDVEHVELQNLAASSLEFQVLFHTGKDALAVENEQRIERLARFLTQQGDMNVRLSGFADPRGDAVYNEVLSQGRIDSIVGILVANGVDESRIATEAFGDQLSVATDGDYDAYALERRVSIELVPQTESTSVAATF